MKKLFLLFTLIFALDYILAQKIDFLGGIEFSKPLFSGKNYSNPGGIVGFGFENPIDKEIKNIKYILEFSLNHVRTIDTRSYPSFEMGNLKDYLIVDHEFYYSSFEFAFLIVFKNIISKDMPYLYSGISIGIGSRGVKSKPRNEVTDVIMYLLDYTETPYTFPLSLNAGLSYSLNDYWDVDLRYKITNPILDDEYFTQNVYLVIHMKLN